MFILLFKKIQCLTFLHDKTPTSQVVYLRGEDTFELYE